MTAEIKETVVEAAQGEPVTAEQLMEMGLPLVLVSPEQIARAEEIAREVDAGRQSSEGHSATGEGAE